MLLNGSKIIVEEAGGLLESLDKANPPDICGQFGQIMRTSAKLNLRINIYILKQVSWLIFLVLFQTILTVFFLVPELIPVIVKYLG